MRAEEDVRRRIAELEDRYDLYDPPSSPLDEEREVAVLRAIGELEWVLGEREEPPSFSE